LNFKGENPHRSDLFVSIAGVCMNLLLFLTCTLLSLAVTRFLWDPDVLRWYDARELLGFDSDIFLAIQLGYFEGLSDFFLRPALVPVLRFLAQTAMVNLYIAVFNLLPVPPLDGSHVFNDLLLKKNLFVQKRTAQIGMALVLLLSFTGWLGQGLSFIADNIQAGLLFLVGSLAHAGL
jgi:Zn-dependent protease